MDTCHDWGSARVSSAYLASSWPAGTVMARPGATVCRDRLERRRPAIVTLELAAGRRDVGHGRSVAPGTDAHGRGGIRLTR